MSPPADLRAVGARRSPMARKPKMKTTRLSEADWAADMAPLLTIICMTYNHEAYVRECLDSFLRQETSFPVEILVHDDASTDRTQDVIREYEARHPRLFRTILQTQNQRSKVGPLLPILVSAARGEYFAFCEGDDYWSYPDKLQSQVDFLMKNPDFVMISHRSIKITQDGIELPDQGSSQRGIGSLTYSENDVIKGTFDHPNSWVARTPKLSEKFLATVARLPMGDDPLNLAMLHGGAKGMSLDATWSAYRQHAGGIWSTLEGWQRRAQELALFMAQKAYYGDEYREQFDVHIERVRTDLGWSVLADLWRFSPSALGAKYAYLKRFRSRSFRPPAVAFGLMVKAATLWARQAVQWLRRMLGRLLRGSGADVPGAGHRRFLRR